MYDPITECFRWRQLFDGRYAVAEETTSADADLGRRLFAEGAVVQLEHPRSGEAGGFWRLVVKAKRDQQVDLDYDVDGRVSRAECTCSVFRRHGLRKGPCAHLTARMLFVARQRAGEAVAK